MGLSSQKEAGLTHEQTRTFKLSVSAACRKMTAEQILDLADHLHMIIHKRNARCRVAEPMDPDPRAANESRSWELQP